MMKEIGNVGRAEQLVAGMELEEGRREAARCLYCYDAPCQRACPAGIEVPQFIKRIRDDNLRGAAETILRDNPLGGICARVCPVEELCEGACVLEQAYGSAIEIARLQRLAMDYFYRKKPEVNRAGQECEKRVAVIGGGAAGLSCAYFLRLKGYPVTVFEAGERAGGLLNYAVSPCKLAAEDLRREVTHIRSLGIKLKRNCQVGEDVGFEELRKKFDAVFMALGLGDSPRIGIPGEEVSGVYNALELMRMVRGEGKARLLKGRKVVVIGGGNTALESCQLAKLLDAEEVSLAYRRSPELMPGYELELAMARLDEVRFYWQTQPVKILGRKKVEGVELVKVRLGKADESGRLRPVVVRGSNFRLPADTVVRALGQEPPGELVKTFTQLKLTRDGFIKVRQRDLATSLPGVYAGGDCLGGEGLVVRSVGEGKRAAEAIHQYLSL